MGCLLGVRDFDPWPFRGTPKTGFRSSVWFPWFPGTAWSSGLPSGTLKKDTFPRIGLGPGGLWAVVQITTVGLAWGMGQFGRVQILNQLLSTYVELR